MFIKNPRSNSELIFETKKETFVFLTTKNKYKNSVLSSYQLHRLKNGDAHLIIFDDSEPTNFYHFKQKFPKLINDIPPQNIVIVSSNLFYTLNPNTLKKDCCPYKIFYFNDCFKIYLDSFKPDNTPFEIKKHYTCLSGVDKYFRRYFYYLLKTNDLLPCGFVSHNRVKNFTEDGDIYFDDKIKNSVIDFDVYKHISKEKLSFDVPSDIRTVDYGYAINNFSKNSGIEIIHETAIKGCNFVSEKTIKAILNKNIFLLVGGYQTLNFLKKLGFKTFDHIVDESYDSIRCDFSRITAVFNSLKKFCTLSLDEVEKIKNDNQELLEYNYNHLLYNLDTTFDLKNKVETYFNKGEINGRN
jgi:hypothetical protein